jgi:hypothetical protein
MSLELQADVSVACNGTDQSVASQGQGKLANTLHNSNIQLHNKQLKAQMLLNPALTSKGHQATHPTQ